MQLSPNLQFLFGCMNSRHNIVFQLSGRCSVLPEGCEPSSFPAPPDGTIAMRFPSLVVPRVPGPGEVFFPLALSAILFSSAIVPARPSAGFVVPPRSLERERSTARSGPPIVLPSAVAVGGFPRWDSEGFVRRSDGGAVFLPLSALFPSAVLVVPGATECGLNTPPHFLR